MKTIWKYRLRELDIVSRIRMRKGAKILHFGTQLDKPCLWALVDSDAEEVYREFLIVGTGWKFEEKKGKKLKYIGTILVRGDSLVWHLFEVIGKEEIE